MKLLSFCLCICTFLYVSHTNSLAQQPPTYSKHIQPFFAKYCVECHNAKKPRAGLSLESYKGLQAGSDNGSVLVPGNAEKSLLVLTLEGKKKPFMPPKKVTVRPKPAEIALLRAWINGGAKGSDVVVNVVLPAIRSKIKAPMPITALTWLPDGNRIVAGSYKRWFVYERSAGAARLSAQQTPEQVTAMAHSPDGKMLAVATGTPGATSALQLIPIPAVDHVWKKGRTIAKAHDDVIQAMAFSPDGKTLVSCGYDRRVKIWDAVGGKVRKTLKEHSDSVYGVAFRPDGKLFATVAADRALKVWETESAKLLYTLGESTDWLYAVAWSPDGKHLAAAGVDKSIRIWKANKMAGEVAHSVFAHQGSVLQLAYAPDAKTLYSASEDRTVKAWDALRMVERKVYPKLNDTPMSLAVSPNGKHIAVGRFDGSLALLDAATGTTIDEPLPKLLRKISGGRVQEKEPNNSPRTGQAVALPAEIMGALGKAGDVDYYSFFAKAGQQLGAQAIPAKNKGKNSSQPFLELIDSTGQVIARSDAGFLGHTFKKAGQYAVGIRDREFDGNAKMTYRLKLGKIPVVTSVFPLGVQRGADATIQVAGVYLGKNNFVKIKGDGAPGTKVTVGLKSPFGKPLGMRQIVIGEFPEILEDKSNPVQNIPVPGTANGQLLTDGETDVWRFAARKGQKLIIEVNARRLGSDVDSFIEILDSKGSPVGRATLRSQAKTYVTFRNHNSVQSNIRIEAWTELTVNDLIFVGNELLKIRRLPTHPDSDCVFFSSRGQRLAYLGTSSTHVAKGEPMYKVTLHPSGTTFPPNGFPVININYRNDDGAAGIGRDSRLVFDPPADGEYLIRIGDSRNRGGENFGYRLTVRPPRPAYSLRFSPTNPSVWKGGAVPITASVDRIDGFDGPVAVNLENLPPGFSAPPTTIPAGEENTTFALWADGKAQSPKKAPKLRLIAEAEINGKPVRREFSGGNVKAVKPGDIVTTTEKSALSIVPGQQAKLTVRIERHNGFKGRIPIDVQGLPHGVKVLDLGLNGILITEKETRRTMVFYCYPWVQPTEHPIVVTARREGKNTQHAARSVLLKIVPNGVSANK